MTIAERAERIRAINRALATDLPPHRRAELVIKKLALFGYGAPEMKVEG